jgi:hypothetical protein
MKGKQNESVLGKRGSKEGRSRKLSVSMKNASEIGSIGRERRRNRGSMRRRGIRKENANEGRRYFMTRKMKMMIREKGGVEVL